MKRAMFLLLLSFWLSACSSQSDNKEPEPSAQPSSESQPPAASQPPTLKVTTSEVATIKPDESPAATADAQPAPKIFVASNKLDFGNQPLDKSITRSFVVKNVGKAELKIESVVPSCGCTSVDFPKTLAPGKSGKIKVKVDTGKSPGSHTKSVTIKSNDPQQPSLQVDFAYKAK